MEYENGRRFESQIWQEFILVDEKENDKNNLVHSRVP